MAIATLWCHKIGEHILKQGETAGRLIDPGPTRELSLLQLGLRWLKRALAVAIHLLPDFKVQGFFVQPLFATRPFSITKNGKWKGIS